MNAAPGSARLVIVEDQTIFRELLAEVLRTEKHLTIVEQYSEGRAALEGCKELRPDLIILDAILPDISGLDVLRQLRTWRSSQAVLIVTGHARPALVRQAVELGARGVVTKSASLAELRTAVTRVLDGGRYFCSDTSPLLADALHCPQGELSPRQREVVQLVARGLSSKEIAEALGISLKTVANHRMQIRERLGVTDIASLTRYAIEHGLVEPKV